MRPTCKKAQREFSATHTLQSVRGRLWRGRKNQQKNEVDSCTKHFIFRGALRKPVQDRCWILP